MTTITEGTPRLIFTMQGDQNELVANFGPYLPIPVGSALQSTIDTLHSVQQTIAQADADVAATAASASAAATSASNSAASAAASTTSASNSAASASQSQTSANASAYSATQAATSATNAAGYANSANAALAGLINAPTKTVSTSAPTGVPLDGAEWIVVGS